MAIRLKEHQRSVYTGDRDSSALAEHALDTGHSIDWDRALALNTCQNLKQRLCLESWHIHRQTVSLNRENGPLYTIIVQGVGKIFFILTLSLFIVIAAFFIFTLVSAIALMYIPHLAFHHLVLVSAISH